MMSTVYDPEEDSYLLKECVEKHAFGKVLDMGCGSGILGIAALQKKEVSQVTFVDINTDALIATKKNISHQKIDIKKCTLIESDLFSEVHDTFDTLVFNPPYLPEDDLDNETLITTGGKQGWEIYERFLSSAKKHLNQKGIILLLFSSLTNKRKIDALIKKNGFSKKFISNKKLFMEELFVYLLKI